MSMVVERKKKTVAPGASIMTPPGMLDPIGIVNPALAKADPSIMISSTPFGDPAISRKFYVKSAVPWKRNATAYPNKTHLNNLRSWARGRGESGVVLASINGRLVIVPLHAAKTAERAGAKVEIIGSAADVYELMTKRAAAITVGP